jgi:hypothetical protein
MNFAVNTIYLCMKHALILLFKQRTRTCFVFGGRTGYLYSTWIDLLFEKCVTKVGKKVHIKI